MAGSTIGGTSPRRARLHRQHVKGAKIEELSWTEARELLAEIDVKVRRGTSTGEAQKLVREHISELSAAGLI